MTKDIIKKFQDQYGDKKIERKIMPAIRHQRKQVANLKETIKEVIREVIKEYSDTPMSQKEIQNQKKQAVRLNSILKKNGHKIVNRNSGGRSYTEWKVNGDLFRVFDDGNIDIRPEDGYETEVYGINDAENVYRGMISEYSVGGYSNTGGYSADMGNTIRENDEYVPMYKSCDHSTFDGMNYHLKECGINTRIDYVQDGGQRMMVRRDDLPKAIDALKNTADELGSKVADKLQEKYFKKQNLNEIVDDWSIRPEIKNSLISMVNSMKSNDKKKLRLHQAKSEFRWLNNKLQTIANQMDNKPSKIKEFNEISNRIKRTRWEIHFLEKDLGI